MSVAPTPDIAVAPVPVAPEPAEVIAALPLPSETSPPVSESVTEPIAPDVSDGNAEPQETAVTASLRPRPRAAPPASQQQEQSGFASTDAFANLRFPTQTIESPLTSYSRSGVDAFAGQVPGDGSILEQGPGNSTTTNYAGLVLVHLNSKPPVAISSGGWARVSFVINPDGSLASVYVIDGSGSLLVDRAAKAQVERGEPFPRPPGGERRQLTFVYSSR
ncbi:MAG: TonB family protein [Arenibacterium sp.]